jgi:hypothetical protein
MGGASSEPVFSLTIVTGRVTKLPQGKKITRPSQTNSNVHAVLDLDQHMIGIPIAILRSAVIDHTDKG